MIELIWDRGRSGTATPPGGASITVGDASDFSPDDLAATAAAGCLMRTFLRRAEEVRVPILSYASAAHVESPKGTGPAQVVIRCYVVAAEGSSAPEIQSLLRESVSQSPICRMLGDCVTCQADIRCLCGARAS
ncbi:MAG TPA: OsmC family protein [Vicinamibacterales bacterium]|nr:OsmC family protein [Vicinamibacterales bacterium]